MSSASVGRPVRTLILGAAGRDFHNFNMVYRSDPQSRVVAFTATQIPDISGRSYPAELAGPLYPEGIPIREEAELEEIVSAERILRVVFAYSDVSCQRLTSVMSRALAAGADFELLGPGRTMLRAGVPVIAVSAVRTGCGKSQTTRWLARGIKSRGRRLAVIRHPMPYGDLAAQAVQCFRAPEDLDAAACTVEEREEYAPHVAMGTTVYAGIDYRRIVEQASAEAELILWDGGNNDLPFVCPDLHIVLIDALRPRDATAFYPGEAVLRTADVVVISKADAADASAVDAAMSSAREIAPGRPIFRGGSPVVLDRPERVRGRRTLIVEDGPTITHGGMPHGAGFVAALRAGAGEIVDPRDSATPEIVKVFERYRHIGRVLPAMGYSPRQLDALRETINRSAAEIVVLGTPGRLAEQIDIDKPVAIASYEFADLDTPGLNDYLESVLDGMDMPEGNP